MQGVVGSLVRRGVDAGREHVNKNGMENFPAWGFVLIGATIVFFTVALTMVRSAKSLSCLYIS